MRHLTAMDLMELGARTERLGKRFDPSKPLRLSRQEAFVQYVVGAFDRSGSEIVPAPMVQTRAYIKAGYGVKGAAQNASRLMNKDNVRARYEWLMAQKWGNFDKEALTAGLQLTVEAAHRKGRPTTMLRSLQNLARLHGFRV
jgi:hypothetical protein